MRCSCWHRQGQLERVGDWWSWRAWRFGRGLTASPAEGEAQPEPGRKRGRPANGRAGGGTGGM
jgi:hypothetical protein